MKMTVACAGHGAPHAGWAAIDELADLLVHYFDATLLSPRRVDRRWPWPRRGRTGWQRMDVEGGDVLFVVAHAPQDLAMIEAIPSVRRRFSRIIGWVTDSYFQGGFGEATAMYDGITVTAREDVDYPRQRFGISFFGDNQRISNTIAQHVLRTLRHGAGGLAHHHHIYLPG